MSYGADLYSSSYRKIFGDSPRYSSSPSRMTSHASPRSGYRSQSASRSGGSSLQGTFNKRSGRNYSSSMQVDHFDLTQSTVLNNEFKIIRTNEKEQMQGLNDRFAMFIDKVRNLEQQNKVLETELTAFRQRQNEPSRLAELYQQEIRELRSQLEEVNAEKSQIMIQRDNIEDELLKVRGKYEEEFRAREEAEATLKAFKKDVDDATMVRLDLEKKVESLLDEIKLLEERCNEEEVAGVDGHVSRPPQISVGRMEGGVQAPDLTSGSEGDARTCTSSDGVPRTCRSPADEVVQSLKFPVLGGDLVRGTGKRVRSRTRLSVPSREELNEFR
ncbi:hypothetical protein CRUP_003041 [Coryphaenoides rupestris]|nr:hypothetical protein CRUP_003041 [Coryphaenoides rupestris]